MPITVKIIFLLFGILFFCMLIINHHFKIKRMLDNRRKKNILDWERYKKGLKPEMRDSILKMR